MLAGIQRLTSYRRVISAGVCDGCSAIMPITNHGNSPVGSKVLCRVVMAIDKGHESSSFRSGQQWVIKYILEQHVQQ